MHARNEPSGMLVLSVAWLLTACLGGPPPSSGGYAYGGESQYAGYAGTLPGEVVYSHPDGLPATNLWLLDVDGDRQLDVVAVFGSVLPARLVVLRGTGGGQLAPALSYQFEDTLPLMTTLVRRRGMAPDLVVWGSAASSAQAATLDVLNVTDQGVTRRLAYTLDASANGTQGQQAMVAHDVNGDGVEDVLVAAAGPALLGGRLHVLHGAADGTFQDQPARLADDGQFTQAAFGDFNGDGRLDVVVTDFAAGKTRVFQAQADGAYRPSVEMEWGIYRDEPTAVITGDFDHDGDTDIRSLHESCYDVYYRNQGDGTFDSAVVYHTQLDPTFRVAAGDRDDDGNLELMITGYTTTVDRLTLGPDGKVQREELVSLPGSATAAYTDVPVAAGDLNGDHATDYVFAGASGYLFVHASGSTNLPLR